MCGCRGRPRRLGAGGLYGGLAGWRAWIARHCAALPGAPLGVVAAPRLSLAQLRRALGAVNVLAAAVLVLRSVAI